MRKFLLIILVCSAVLSSSFPSKANITTPDVAMEYEGHYYQLYTLTMTWEEAQDYFNSIGGHLAVITTQGENDFLFNYLLSMGYTSAFFGASDTETPGIWRWVTGETFQYSNWNPKVNSSQSGTNHYAMFCSESYDGTWDIGEISEQNGSVSETLFLCEWDHLLERSYSAEDTFFSSSDVYQYEVSGNQINLNSSQEAEASPVSSFGFRGIQINLWIDNLSLIDLSMIGIGGSSVIGFLLFLVNKLKNRKKRQNVKMRQKRRR